MKNSTITTALALSAMTAFTEPAPLRVALTFDDSLKDHLLIAAPMLEERGWRGTFCIVTDWVGKDDMHLTWRDATHSASEQYFKFGRMFDVSATGFSGALDMWRISSGLLSKEELLCYKIMGLVIKVM